MSNCQLYLLTPPQLNPEKFKPLLVEALEAGPIAAVQLRLKNVTDLEICQAIEILKPVVQERDIAFILNDRPDLAKKFECDGVHIGMEDMPIQQARQIVRDHLQLGVSCYDSKDLAMQAGELLKWWSELMELPVVAIGGITPENCKPLVKAGADFLAVINAVWGHAEGPAQGIKEMLKSINEAEQE